MRICIGRWGLVGEPPQVKSPVCYHCIKDIFEFPHELWGGGGGGGGGKDSNVLCPPPPCRVECLHSPKASLPLEWNFPPGRYKVSSDPTLGNVLGRLSARRPRCRCDELEGWLGLPLLAVFCLVGQFTITIVLGVSAQR